LGKLFSTRDKNRDDLRALAPRLGHDGFAEHLRANGAALASDPRLRQAAEKNWFIVFGEQLPG